MHLRSRNLPRLSASSPLDNRAPPMANASQLLAAANPQPPAAPSVPDVERSRHSNRSGIALTTSVPNEQGIGTEHQVRPYVKGVPLRNLVKLDPELDAINTGTNAPITVDALVRQTDPPFTERVLRTRISSKFKLPTQLGIYEGKTDPMDHLDSYKSLMSLQGCSDEVMCKAFSATLKGPASDKVIIMAMMEGLRPGPLFDSLSKNVPETLSALQSKADKYIVAEELAEAKRRRRGKDDHKRKEPDTRRTDYREETRCSPRPKGSKVFTSPIGLKGVHLAKGFHLAQRAHRFSPRPKGSHVFTSPMVLIGAHHIEDHVNMGNLAKSSPLSSPEPPSEYSYELAQSQSAVSSSPLGEVMQLVIDERQEELAAAAAIFIAGMEHTGDCGGSRRRLGCWGGVGAGKEIMVDEQPTVRIALKLDIDIDDMCKGTNVTDWGEAATSPSSVEMRPKRRMPSRNSTTNVRDLKKMESQGHPILRVTGEVDKLGIGDVKTRGGCGQRYRKSELNEVIALDKAT
ncbi:hypothetical protein Acr_09g0010440 [Actinidia rufa]|uniref:Uncharacterized protein n=1 Tax=Actinidia rufa TaxID=165716 RepID=A0A7J0F7C3_9ERIC|nr:hypothetical protein Acr_09g0010440 [Actinidia rufa]